MLIHNQVNKIPYYIIYFFLFIIAQSFSMWGIYNTLIFKNISMWEAYKLSIPFAWIDWFIMTFVINLGNKYELVTTSQDTFLLIIIQFFIVLLINKYYLKQKIYRSDIAAFFIILIGFFISIFKIITNFYLL